jgi:hypothetical protein
VCCITPYDRFIDELDLPFAGWRIEDDRFVARQTVETGDESRSVASRYACHSRKFDPTEIRAVTENQSIIDAMFAIIYLLGTFIADLFKSRRWLEVENLFLRHQLNITLRRPPQRLRLRGSDRALMVWMTRLWPNLLVLARVVQPATILRWHRAGFRTYWRWKSQGRPGRPRIEHELRYLIRRMSEENPLWGAPRIHGDLLKLGLEVAESRFRST